LHDPRGSVSGLLRSAARRRTCLEASTHSASVGPRSPRRLNSAQTRGFLDTSPPSTAGRGPWAPTLPRRAVSSGAGASVHSARDSPRRPTNALGDSPRPATRGAWGLPNGLGLTRGRLKLTPI
jgi:hypothetical protein